MFKTCSLLFLEILPIIVFFVVGQYLPFLEALVVYLVATLFTIGVILYTSKRISYLALIFGVIIIGSGSLSIWLHNPDILLVADTLYYLGAALVLFILKYNNVNLLQKLFGSTFGMTTVGWNILTNRWIILLALSGICNELVRQFGNTHDWLLFQLIRTFVFLIFATYQFTLTRKYRIVEETTSWGVRF
jgi:intracellular septation protein